MTEQNLIRLLEYLPGLLQTLGWGGVVWGWWSLKRIFVPHEDCKKCRAELEEKHELLESRQTESLSRQSTLKKALDQLPTAKDLQEIALSLVALQGDMKGLSEKVDGQGRSLARVEKSVDLLTEVHMGNGK